jgi:hypothetical protein
MSRNFFTWREKDKQEKFYCHHHLYFDLHLIRIRMLIDKRGLFSHKISSLKGGLK